MQESNETKGNSNLFEWNEQRKRKYTRIFTTVVIIEILAMVFYFAYDYVKTKRTVELLYTYAAKAETDGDNARAIQKYHQITVLNPKEAQAYFKLGFLFYQQNEFEKSEKYFNEALELRPDNAKFHYHIGNLYYRKEEFSKAKEEYRKAVSLDPNYGRAWNTLGHFHMIRKQYTEAVNCYRKVLELNPKDVNLFYTRANVAEIYFLKEQPERSVHHIEIILKRGDLSPSVQLGLQFSLIAALLMQGEKQEANAVENVYALIEYYRSLQQEYERVWQFQTIKEYIRKSNRFKEKYKELLLRLIDILESPKAEGDKKIKSIDFEIENG